MSVDETLTDLQFRTLWQQYADAFLGYWFDPGTRFLFYLRDVGGQVVYGRAGPFLPTIFTGSFVDQAVAAVNQFNAFRLRNPAGSGVTIYCTYVAASQSAARRFALTKPNAADANRTNTVSIIGKFSATTPTAAGTFTFDNNLAANLANPFHIEKLVAGTPSFYREGVLIASGGSLDIQVGDTGNAAGETSTCCVEWIEF